MVERNHPIGNGNHANSMRWVNWNRPEDHHSVLYIAKTERDRHMTDGQANSQCLVFTLALPFPLTDQWHNRTRPGQWLQSTTLPFSSILVGNDLASACTTVTRLFYLIPQRGGKSKNGVIRRVLTPVGTLFPFLFNSFSLHFFVSHFVSKSSRNIRLPIIL